MRLLGFRSMMGRTQQQAVAQRGSDFVRNSFPVDKRNSRFVSLVRVLPIRRGWSSVTVTKVRGERARLHDQRVQVDRTYRGTFRKCTHVMADCDCSRFTFVWNYALLQKGLAIEDHTNGEAPDTTNPEQALGCCKHLIIILRFLWRDNPSYPHGSGLAPSTGRSVRLTTVRESRR